ncbi:hypothetical protein A8B75_18045 [Sphingomonadales bacterium EhC05]|nr:hypothetical protein A8B75_18045 [Sphingomonadales bacterium EhC05]
MELRSEFLIPAISKTLKDVVLPALTDEQEVAQEQVNLAIGFLDIIAKQQPLQYAFDADELKRHQVFADELCSLLGLEGDHATIIAEAKKLSDQGTGSPEAVVATTRQLREVITEIAANGHARGDQELSKNVSSKMNDFARVQLARERAWVAPMGFETGADKLPSIEEQLK